jgi:hypothetical protein
MACSKMSELEGMLWSNSLFFRDKKLGDKYRQDVLCVLPSIKESVFMPGPKLVFAHFLSPHPPYVFDENGGNVVPHKEQGDISISPIAFVLNKKSYLGQAKYMEKNLLEVVNFILKKSKQPPIIIIQGDHGFSPYSDIDTMAGKKIPSPENINARMRVLAAYFFPQGGNVVLYDTITPVNMVRGMLQYYFHRDDLAKLPDMNYWSGVDMFQFFDVTDVVKKENPTNIARM